MSAPKRMFVRQFPNGAMGRWHDATSLPETAAMTSGSLNPMHTYILATPSALAQSPEAQVLIREAVAAERERCAGIADGFGLTWEAVCMAGNNGGVCDDGCDGCIGVATYCSADQIAAAIRTPDAPASADAGRAG